MVLFVSCESEQGDSDDPPPDPFDDELSSLIEEIEKTEDFEESSEQLSVQDDKSLYRSESWPSYEGFLKQSELSVASNTDELFKLAYEDHERENPVVESAQDYLFGLSGLTFKVFTD